MIKFENITKYFDTPDARINILLETSFEIKENEFVALMAPSWSGKTTILNMISWIDNYQNWKIIVNNQNIADLKWDDITTRRGQNISFIFQQFYLVPQLTIEENIDLIIDLNNIKRQFETDEILWLLNLLHRRNSYPHELSGGEQQRVAIARAFVGKTGIILADEPTGNLDAKNAEIIMKILQDLHKKSKKTILMITHDKNIAIRAEKIISLSNYKIENI